jgi:hypothetical protein
LRLVAAGRVFANKGDRAAGVLGRESKLVHQLAKVRFMSKPADTFGVVKVLLAMMIPFNQCGGFVWLCFFDAAVL